MSAYLWCMAAGSVIIYALYGWRCACCGSRKCAKSLRGLALRKKPWLTAALAFLFSVLFGAVLSRVGYALLMQEEFDFEFEGFTALGQLLDFNYRNLSFFCGAVGVCLGVLLANRLTRKGGAFEGLDAFAPFGALLAALFRMGEIFMGSHGVGRKLESDTLAFFPFAVKITGAGGREFWFWAVFVLSAVLALAWAAVAFHRFRGPGRTGYAFTLTIFFLSLGQILCESLRNSGMLWLFVHAEELLCAVVLLAVMLFWIITSRPRGPRAAEECPSPRSRQVFRHLWPLLLLLLCIGLLVPLEFVIGGKLIDLHRSVCYLIMLVLLVPIGIAGFAAAKRWNKMR